jgi:hypothetical protein
VLGKGWLSVAVIPAASPLNGVKGPGTAAAGQMTALLRLLMNTASRVHGTWGSGRLLRTSLFSVLFTSRGQVLIGAVTPSVLTADAAKVK